MRRFIMGVVVGVVLATASVASAYERLWAKSGSTYSCTGLADAVLCTSKVTKVQMLIGKHGDVNVYTRHDRALFRCAPSGRCMAFE
jgi:hypothetical protein